jgi:hypothetical protein
VSGRLRGKLNQTYRDRLTCSIREISFIGILRRRRWVCWRAGCREDVVVGEEGGRSCRIKIQLLDGPFLDDLIPVSNDRDDLKRLGRGYFFRGPLAFVPSRRLTWHLDKRQDPISPATRRLCARNPRQPSPTLAPLPPPSKIDENTLHHRRLSILPTFISSLFFFFFFSTPESQNRITTRILLSNKQFLYVRSERGSPPSEECVGGRSLRRGGGRVTSCGIGLVPYRIQIE